MWNTYNYQEKKGVHLAFQRMFVLDTCTQNKREKMAESKLCFEEMGRKKRAKKAEGQREKRKYRREEKKNKVAEYELRQKTAKKGAQGRVEGGHTMTDGLYFDCFGDLLLGHGQHRLTADFRLEQRVHKSRLSKATLSCKQKPNQRINQILHH